MILSVAVQWICEMFRAGVDCMGVDVSAHDLIPGEALCWRLDAKRVG